MDSNELANYDEKAEIPKHPVTLKKQLNLMKK